MVMPPMTLWNVDKQKRVKIGHIFLSLLLDLSRNPLRCKNNPFIGPSASVCDIKHRLNLKRAMI